MAEFKFSCPHCGQNIRCDEQWGGQQIVCPACSGNLVVPQSRPVARAVGAAQSAPVINQPQAAARPAKEGPRISSAKIGAWLLGGAAFLVAMYFGLQVANHYQAKFNKKSKEMAANAPEGELVHTARIYQVLDATDTDKQQERAAKAQLRAQRQYARMQEELKPKPDPTLTMPVLPAAWTLDLAAITIPKGRVNGSSGGTAFHVESVQLNRGASSAVLTFQEGAGTAADHELFIYLPVSATENLAGKSWTVIKESKPKDTPQITRKWTYNPKFAPMQKTFSRGYVMKLELDQPGRDWQPGRIFLALPDTNQTVIAGEFSLPVLRDDLDMLPQ